MQHPIVKTIKSRMAAVRSIEDLGYLDLSQIECQVLPKEAKVLLEKCHNLQQIVLNNCGLVSLQNLPQLQISILQLSSNNLTDNELQKLSVYKSTLQQVNLQYNKLSDINIISTFRCFQKLEEINLKGNPICSIFPNYNVKIFAQILSQHPTLKIVDCYRKNGEIISDEEGKDEELDGPAWMLSQNIEEEVSNQDNNSSARSENNSQQNTEPVMDKKQNLLKLYSQNQKSVPGFMIKYLNENERFVDPIDNCFDEEMSFEDEQDEEEFRTEIEKGEFKYKQSKKRKCEFRFNSRQEY